MNYSKKCYHSGFTLVEILLVISITLILVASASPIVSSFFTSTQLNEITSQAQQVIQSARQKARSGLNDAAQGVYFEHNALGADRIIEYQGSSYATRDTQYDYIITLDTAVTVTTTLTNSEVTFTNGPAVPSSTGTVTFTQENSNTTVLTITSAGTVIEE